MIFKEAQNSLLANQSNFASKWDYDLVDEVMVTLKRPEDERDWTFASYLMKNKNVFKLIDEGLKNGAVATDEIAFYTDEQLIAGLNHLLGPEFADYTDDENDLKTDQQRVFYRKVTMTLLSKFSGKLHMLQQIHIEPRDIVLRAVKWLHAG